MRFLLVTFYLTILSVTIHAQKLSGGLRGGINFAQWKQEVILNSLQTGTISTAFTSDSRTGYLLGIYYTLMFNQKIGLQPELLYNSVGSKSGSSTINVNYVSLPVFLRYNIADRVHVLGGPQASYLISAEGQNTSPTGAVTTNIKDSLTSMDFGIVLGLGVDLGKLNLGIRYFVGFTNIAKNPTGSSSGVNFKQDISNRGWQVLAGYRLFGK